MVDKGVERPLKHHVGIATTKSKRVQYTHARKNSKYNIHTRVKTQNTI
jgi:hypothetical protein